MRPRPNATGTYRGFHEQTLYVPISFPFPSTPGPVDALVRWTQALTGLELDDAGAVRVLDAASWRKRMADPRLAAEAPLSSGGVR